VCICGISLKTTLKVTKRERFFGESSTNAVVLLIQDDFLYSFTFKHDVCKEGFFKSLLMAQLWHKMIDLKCAMVLSIDYRRRVVA